ncbi:glycoside hydrolase family 105 protein [Parabacteroides sp. FAFU027]|uniref:glycoside hydrolase family 88/105 protein n=1 Tax=Parabacteroides sp. FAFU027 TaxID=2922715 RepID=UPI001FAFD849|nr:glycoside hydrolase family 88 protein [Parabacteroides sp. FAFU027]
MKKLFCVVVILFNLNTKFYAQKTTISLLADTSSNLGARKIGSRDIYNKSYIKNLMKDVFHWQINNPVLINDFKEQWARSVFYSGIMYAYRSTGDTMYVNQTKRWGDASGWKRGPKYRHADDLACGQAYLDAYATLKSSIMMSGIKTSIDSLIAAPKQGRKEWWWCDALFMEPPVLVRLGNLTGDDKYYRYLDQMYWDTSDYLYSKGDSLYYRDSRYFKTLTKRDKKTFWSRGNAWVLGGLVQILSIMPKKHSEYKKYEDHYREIMIKVASLQQPDGLWRASLLDPEEVPVKETSGSAFFTFAMAWGINNGLLDKTIYTPKLKKAWKALVEAVASNGKLRFVQQIGDKPENVKAEDNQEYGSGAFLMAGSEILKLSKVEIPNKLTR